MKHLAPVLIALFLLGCETADDQSDPVGDVLAAAKVSLDQPATGDGETVAAKNPPRPVPMGRGWLKLGIYRDEAGSVFIKIQHRRLPASGIIELSKVVDLGAQVQPLLLEKQLPDDGQRYYFRSFYFDGRRDLRVDVLIGHTSAMSDERLDRDFAAIIKSNIVVKPGS